MAEVKEKLPGEAYCFACGPENPIGLHLDFQFVADKYVAEKNLLWEIQVLWHFWLFCENQNLFNLLKGV